MISLENVGVRLGQRTVISDITLDIARGSWTCLVGPNGAGKTTLLRALLGVLPYSGSIRIDGMQRQGDIERNLAFVPQRPEIPAGMTVDEYVMLGRAKRDGWGRTSTRGREVVRATLESSHLMGLRHQYVNRLSGGEVQRVLIARAIAQEASVVLLDEPTSALDLHHQVAALDQIDALRDLGTTIVSTMHDITLGAMYADRFALLRDGRLTLDGPSQDVVHAPEFSALYEEGVHVFTLETGHPVVIPNRRRQA